MSRSNTSKGRQKDNGRRGAFNSAARERLSTYQSFQRVSRTNDPLCIPPCGSDMTRISSQVEYGTFTPIDVCRPGSAPIIY